ncbi:hypothetical protein AN1V17_47180 [Vallitalea sediminicola]
MKKLQLTIGNIDNRVEELRLIKSKMLNLLDIETDNIYDLILQMYIEIQSVKMVADYINDKGFRIETEFADKVSIRKYISNDITEIILSNTVECNTDLKQYAKTLFNYNKGRQYFSDLLKLASK